MKPYTLASERAAAPTGCAYIAPLFWNKWFRWGGSQASGTRSSDGHWTTADPQSIAFRRQEHEYQPERSVKNPAG